MSWITFADKWFKGETSKQIIDYLGVLDNFYLKYTREQVIELVNDFYDNADDIFNSIGEGYKHFQRLLNEIIDKKKKLEYN